jgi:hypothetical protein
MRPLSGARLVLASVAFIGWGLFILGCMRDPEWSPDSKRILFRFTDHASDRSGVALYDRDTDQVTVIWSLDGMSTDFTPQWSSDGHQAIITTCSDNLIEVLLPGMRPGEPIKSIRVGAAQGECEISLPVPEVDGKLFLATEETTFVVDYRTGQVLSHPPLKGPLIAQNGRIFELSFSDDEEQISIALFNPDDLTTTPWFQVSKDDLRIKGIDAEAIVIWAAVVSPSAEEVAIPLTRKGAPSISVVLSRNGDVQPIIPDFSFRKVELGAIAWAADGSKLYATAMVSIPGSHSRMFSIAAIPRGKGKAELTPVAVYDESSEDLLYAQLSLSPDGTILAATTAAFPNGSVTDENRALFLFDLADPDSPPKKVNIPGLGKPAAKSTSKE